MKLSKNKATIISLALIIAMVSTTIFAAMPNTAADINIDNYAFLVVAPNPIGVGQTVAASMWLDKLPPLDIPGGDSLGTKFHGFTLEIQKPDGHNETKGPFTSDYTGAYSVQFTPDQTGTYYFTFIYPGENITGRRASGQPVTTDYYKPATSRTVALNVTETQIADYPGVSLPTGYWERPIYGENREWAQIGGNWLGIPLGMGTGANSTGAYNPYSTAPATAHIMWAKPVMMGGIVGGSNDNAFYSGLSYEEYWNPPSVIIMGGRMYYQLKSSPDRAQGLVCTDLRTGEQIWFQNGSSAAFGQLLNMQTFNQHGVIPYLWTTGSTYTAYDAWTGEVAFRITNAVTSTTAQPLSSKTTTDANGNIIVYMLDATNNWLVQWNSTRAVYPQDTVTWNPSPTGNYRWPNGIMWNVSIPNIPGQTMVTASGGIIITAAAFMEANVRTVSGYDEATGEHLWTFNLTDFNQRAQYNFSPVIDGYFGWFKQETKVWYGFEARTGKQVWESKPYEDDFTEYFSSYRGAGPSNPTVGYGTIFTTTYDGAIHANSIKNGTEVWTFFPGSAGFETAYGVWPFYGGATVGGGVVFASNNEHTPNDPLFRGGQIYAVNATTGTKIWSISGWMPGMTLVDGYLSGVNYYDGQLYTFGKGKSATTASATPKVTAAGTTMVIEGTVTDQTPDAHLKGTPAVSDASMSDWMEYIFMQKEMPMNATGVPVSIYAIDPNNNWVHIGDTTSDASGLYSFAWETPDIPGKYTIVATFAGSGGYYASSAETSAVVEEAPVATAAPTQPQSVADVYFVPATVGIIVAIIIVVALLLLVLRTLSKRP
jgi:outer membrane protein assembly factor BamB